MILTVQQTKCPYKAALKDRFIVGWRNWKNRKVARAYKTLSAALKNDPGYALSWKANIAMPIHDNSVITLSDCNKIADKLMKHLFGVDTTNL